MIETDLDLTPVKHFMQEFIATKGGNIIEDRIGLCTNIKKYTRSIDYYPIMINFTKAFTGGSITLPDYENKNISLYTGDQLKMRLEFANFILQEIDKMEAEI